MAELKPKSFRIDEATSEKFKEISQAMGENQQETLARLIQTYELEQAKWGYRDIPPKLSKCNSTQRLS